MGQTGPGSEKDWLVEAEAAALAVVAGDGQAGYKAEVPNRGILPYNDPATIR